ncbi:DUF1802 family protein [Fodinisporobacter ferrooxydans]|uniref:DUF1802 family protein n=1 Tax=Fodinisporobacter ferrooxydans TaxID=2901836 RepID=A0ABY4CRJ1_9BACL|nr:DUF1802 family protein [Alicyclobacillaceae bacterium MYW30-H2]
MSINHRSFSEQLHCPRIPVKEIALKEWDVVIQAMEAGQQVILVRKGGLIEETKDFRLEDTSFYLFPTFEHQKRELLKSAYGPALEHSLAQALESQRHVTIRSLAHVTDDIELFDSFALKKLSPYHIFRDEYAEQRLNWQKNKPLHILIIRGYRLQSPVAIPVIPQYAGCKSWIRMESMIADNDCIPILDDQEFHRKRLDILRRLGVSGAEN